MTSRKKAKSSRSSLRRNALGFESLEHRRVLAVFINELMLDPLFGDRSTDQFVEVRNDDLGPIPDDTYLVFVDSDITAAGDVHTIFNLSGLPTGSNGILTLLEQGHPYTLDASGHSIVSTAEEFGGLPEGVYQGDTSLSDRIDFIVGSNTAMLIETATPPTLGIDIDDNNDGIAESLPADWVIHDSISLLTSDGFAYSDLAFRNAGVTGANEITVEGIDYAARVQDSTGQTADDWVVGTVQQFEEGGQRVFRFTHGIFGNPNPSSFAGRYIDHVAGSNFHGAFSGRVFDGAGTVTNATVYVDANRNGVMDNVTYTVRPEDFVDAQELTNEAPRATLTVADDSGDQGTSKVTSLLPDSTSGLPTVFGSSGIPSFSSNNPLRIDFPEPANSITAEFLGRSASTFGRLEVFNAAGESLQFLHTSALETDEVQSITINQADIAYALAYSDDNFQNSSPFGTVTQLQYRIPEHRDLTDADGSYMIDYVEPGTYDIRVAGIGALASRTITSTEHVRGTNFALGGAATGLIVEDGNTLTVTGSGLDDQIHVAAGLTEHVITINGASQPFSATRFTNIDVHALGGADFVTIVGTSLDDQADLLATRGKLVSPNYQITFDGAEKTSIFGGDGGLDKAIMADSVGDDVFLGSASFAMMRDIRNAYRNETRGFDIITGNSVLGGNDQALVFGTAGSDNIKVFPEFAQLTRGAGNTEFRANRFERFEARGVGGVDTGEFVDSVGDDHITLEFQRAEMIGPGYANKITDFDTIHARATRGGNDSATFFDSAGDDTLNIRPDQAMYMQGPGFENRIWGFDSSEAFANGGGDDESFLYDTAGNDIFIAHPTSSLIRGTIGGEAYEHITHNFETMTGHAMSTGFDAAFVYDGAGDDSLTVRPDFVEVQGANNSFKHRLLDFQTVIAHANAGGNDTATFLDTSVFSSDPTNDVFKSTPTRSSLEQPGTPFRKIADGYEIITALSTTGTDVAQFLDVGSAEQLNLSGNIAVSPARNTIVDGFGSVRATSRIGETATADLNAVNFVFDQIGQWNNI